MLAATADAVAAAALLVEAGAGLEARNHASRTALFLTAVSGSPGTLGLLIAAGADVSACLPACITCWLLPVPAGKPDSARLHTCAQHAFTPNRVAECWQNTHLHTAHQPAQPLHTHPCR